MKFKLKEKYIIEGPLTRDDVLYGQVVEITEDDMRVIIHYNDGTKSEKLSFNFGGYLSGSHSRLTKTLKEVQKRYIEYQIKRLQEDILESRNSIKKLRESKVNVNDALYHYRYGGL